MMLDLTHEAWLKLGWYSLFQQQEITIRDITSDSRKVRKKTAFFAFDGAHFAGKDFVFDALEKGAVAVFVDKKYEAEICNKQGFNASLPIFFANDFLQTSVLTVSFLYGDPAHKMSIIGVTGTNGKTTIAYSIYRILNELGHKSAYFGTLGIYLGHNKEQTGLTTPDMITNQSYLAEAYKQKIRQVAFEASSHGLQQGRVSGIPWNIAIFTNLTAEHLDYHENMDKYFLAKRILFEQLLTAAKQPSNEIFGAVICTNTIWGEKLASWLKSKNPSFPVITLGENADATMVSIEPSWAGYKVAVLIAQKSYTLETKFIGTFNLRNLACVFLALRIQGFDADRVLAQIAALDPPPGRMEVLKAPGARHIVIDYAHTPDALENALKTLNELNPIRIIVVFGCGGERDREKRPLMAKVASQNADFIVLTNDNPRNEDAQSILSEIKQGMTSNQYITIPEREKAILAGMRILGSHEVLLIAGKGHEDYQIIGETKTKFSDRETVLKLLSKIEYTP